MLYKVTIDLVTIQFSFEGVNEDVVADILKNFKKRAIYYYRGESNDVVINFDKCECIGLEKIPQ